MNLEYFITGIRQTLPEPHASLLVGMLFGTKESLSDELYEALIRTGTVHLVALSGMNISILMRLVFDSLARFAGKKLSIGITLLSIIWFVSLVGAGPTIVRAAIMGSLALLAGFFGRRAIAFYTLTLAATLMLVIDFSLISDVSFQLSFLATLGIILCANRESTIFGVGKRLEEEGSTISASPSLISGIRNTLTSDLKVTLAAQLFTLPVIMFHFHRVSLISPLANIAVGWMVPFIMYAGIVLIIVSVSIKPLAFVVGLVIWVPLTIFIVIINWLSRVPFASLGF
jgi:competence protein ComEC